MTNEQTNTDALRTTTPTSIADLSPDLLDLSQRIIDGSVTITWPFSASKRLLAFVLADHDFRQRRHKGQVRLEFHGSAGKALDKAKIASGDTVRLSLNGVEWQKQEGPQPGLTGEPLGWQLKFSRKLQLFLRRLDGTEDEYIQVNSEDADEFEPAPAGDAAIPSLSDFLEDAPADPPAPQTPMMNVSTKRLASTAFENLEEFVSPAFLKRAKVSYGSLFEGGIDALEEESTKREKKGRRKSRFSMPTAGWRYSSRSPSPEKDQDSESAVSEDEVPIPGLSFSSKPVAQKSPEPEVSMVNEASQTEEDTPGASALGQESATLQSSGQEHFALPAQPRPAADLTDSAVFQQHHEGHVISSLPTEWMPIQAAELHAPLPFDGPITPTPDGGFAFSIEPEPLRHTAHDQHQLYVPVSSGFTYDMPTTTATGASDLTFAMETQHHDPLPIVSTLDPMSHNAGPVSQHNEHAVTGAQRHASSSPPSSNVSQPASGIRSQPVDTIEILSSSPIQSPSASRAPLVAESPQLSLSRDSAAAHSDRAESEVSQEEVQDKSHASSGPVHATLNELRHQPTEQEPEGNDYDDEDAEGSITEVVERTHDPTSEDDTEVPGEDYDLRKYDDAQEDDEEGNVDRDSLLSTDGEGNVIPARGGIMSPSNSDSEEEGAALDIDDDQAGDVAHVHDGADDYDSDVEDDDPEDYDRLSDGEEFDENEENYDSEDLQSESEEEDEMEEVPKPQGPVFIDLLSDSEDEDEARGPAKPSSSVPPPAVTNAYSHPEAKETIDQAASAHASEGQIQQHEGHDAVVSEAPTPREEAEPDVEMEDAPTEPSAEAPVDVPDDDASDHGEAIDEADEKPDDLVPHPISNIDEVMEEVDSLVPDQHKQVAREVDKAKLHEETDFSVAEAAATQEPTDAPAEISTHTATDVPRNLPVEVPTERASAAATVEFKEASAVAVSEDSVEGAGPAPDPTSKEDATKDLNTQSELSVEKTAERAHQVDSSMNTSTFSTEEVDAQPEALASQAVSAEVKYHTQPPQSFEEMSMTQTDTLTQTVIDSQTQARSEAIVLSGHTAPPSQSTQNDSDVLETVEAEHQQQITPMETQEGDPADEVSLVDVPQQEHSPGPDDQLHLEMQQWKPDGDANMSQRSEDSFNIITEEDELAAIEDEAEHDPSLAERDLIITVDSLRSHDHKDEATAKFTRGDSQAASAQDARSGDKTPPRLRARVPPKVAHRKTRSQGSVDILTGEAAVPSSPTGPSLQPPNTTDEVPEATEVPKTPPRLRASRRKGAVRHLDVVATDVPQRASRETPQDGHEIEHTRELRSSPRANNRGRVSDTAADIAARHSPSVGEPSQTAETARSTKTQLLKMLHAELPEFLSLKVLRNSLTKTVDILGVAAITPAAPVRPKNGPRDYMLELIMTDPSTAPSSVSVAQIYRPHQKSLPVVEAGDVVLLRRFQVLSMKGRGFGIRAGDDSSWAVFEKDDDEKLPQIMGPPLEVTDEEVRYAEALAGWWNAMDEDVRSRAEKAGEKAMTVPGGGK